MESKRNYHEKTTNTQTHTRTRTHCVCRLHMREENTLDMHFMLNGWWSGLCIFVLKFFRSRLFTIDIFSIHTRVDLLGSIYNTYTVIKNFYSLHKNCKRVFINSNSLLSNFILSIPYFISLQFNSLDSDF